MSTVEIAKLLVYRDQRLAITILVIKPHSQDSGSATTSYIQSIAKNTIDRISFIQLPQDKTLPLHDPKTPMASYMEFINSDCKTLLMWLMSLMFQATCSLLLMAWYMYAV
ncbi:putative flavonol 3-O-glucosyltransferase [Helianthus debilis subsp. tardiflorus]